MDSQGSLDVKWKVETKTNVRKELEESHTRPRAEENLKDTIINILREKKANIASVK